MILFAMYYILQSFINFLYWSPSNKRSGWAIYHRNVTFGVIGLHAKLTYNLKSFRIIRLEKKKTKMDWSFNNHFTFSFIGNKVVLKQENIPVGCLLSAWKLYVILFQLPPPDFTHGQLVGPQMNKFEQVSRDHHQMLQGARSLDLILGVGWGGVGMGMGWLGPQIWCLGEKGSHLTFSGGTLPCDLPHDAFYVTYPPTPVNRQMPV